MKTLKPVDVVIIGGGWTGLLMAKELGARTSLNIVVLERGAQRKSGEYAHDMDELDYAIRLRMMQNPSRETVTLRNGASQRALPLREFASFLPGDGLGGAGEHWNGLTPRFEPTVFTIRTSTKERYGEKRIPENCTIQDWGVTYDELEPYYDRVEKLLGISGKAGHLKGEKVPGGDPFEGNRSSEYPAPPLKLTYAANLFADEARRLGWHPYPSAAANLSRVYRNPDGIVRAACAYCGYCDRFGCMIGAKAQPTNTLLPVINKQKRVTITTQAEVRRIEFKDGRAAGVRYVSSGEEFLQPAAMVFLSSWTLSNTRLLLLSKAPDPHANLGRNLTHQVRAWANGLSREPLNRFMGAGALGAACSDFDGDNFDHSKLDFIRGGSLTVTGFGSRPIANFSFNAREGRNWGSEWKKASIAAFDHSISVSATLEHLAYRQNFMDLDPTYRDHLGDPLLRFTLDWTEHDHRMTAWLSARSLEAAKEMRLADVRPQATPKHYSSTYYQTTHLQGGTIMGVSPDTSVLNPWLQHWQLPNLFVLGASAFPQNASGNPTLTLLAQVLRTADAIVGRYLKHPRHLL